MNHIYIGDRELEPPESDYACPGCGQYFNGFGSQSRHMRYCQKYLKAKAEDFDQPDNDYGGEEWNG